MKKILMVFLIVSSVVGCAAMEVEEEARGEEELQDVDQARGLQVKTRVIKDCRKQWKNPGFDVIRDKVSAFENHIPVRYTALENRASQEEKEVLLAYAELRNSCQKEMLEAVAEYYAWSLPGYYEYLQRFQTAFAELYAGTLSYGEYNKLAQQSRIISRDRYDELALEYNQLSIAEQRKRIEANRNRLHQDPQFVLPEPRLQDKMTYTDCHWVGQQINCTSH